MSDHFETLCAKGLNTWTKPEAANFLEELKIRELRAQKLLASCTSSQSCCVLFCCLVFYTLFCVLAFALSFTLLCIHSVVYIATLLLNYMLPYLSFEACVSCASFIIEIWIWKNSENWLFKMLHLSSAKSVFIGAPPNLFFRRREAPMGSMIR